MYSHKSMSVIKVLGCASVFLIGVSAFAAGGVVSAVVDKTSVKQGETLEFILNIPGRSDVIPNFSALEKDFQIKNAHKTQQHEALKTNDQILATQWVLSITPKRPGSLQIPPIKIGQAMTEPLKVQVLADATIPVLEEDVVIPGSTAAEPGIEENDSAPKIAMDESMNAEMAPKSAPVFLTTEISSESPYVNSQLTYTVRLFYAVSVDHASLSEPQVEAAKIMRLGDDRHYTQSIQSQNYQVFERKYAIFPEKSGKLVITAPTFMGEVQDGQSVQAELNQHMSFAQPMRIGGENKIIEVQAAPTEQLQNTAAWLPAQQMTLTESWDRELTQAQVGQPITRTLTLTAYGLRAEQLPVLNPSTVENVGVQIETQPVELHNHMQDDRVVGQRIERVIYTLKTGDTTLNLPELALSYWDTKNHHATALTIPARQIGRQATQSKTLIPTQPSPVTTLFTRDVKNKKHGVTADSPKKSIVVKNHSEKNAASKPATVQAQGAWQSHFLHGFPLWVMLTLIFLLAWVVTLFLGVRWWRQYRGGTTRIVYEPRMSEMTQLRQAIKEACWQQDPVRTKDALVRWASHCWESGRISSLGDVLNLIDSFEFKTWLNDLNRTLYAKQQKTWDGLGFWHAFVIYTQRKLPGDYGSDKLAVWSMRMNDADKA